MKRPFHFTALCFCVLFLCGLASATTFHVATTGNDGNAGTEQKPFATIERARDAIRQLKSSGGGKLAEPVDVILQAGVYRLEKMLELTPLDGGAEKTPITYRSAAGQTAIVSGGRPITGWRKADKELWQATIPQVQAGQWYFHQLFVNGQRRTRARTPNAGYLYTEGILAPFHRTRWSDPKILAKTGFIYRPGDLTVLERERDKSPDALIFIYHSWTTSVHLVTDLDSQQRAIRLAPISKWPIGYWWEYNTRYHLENVPEALDQPGEWYLDRRTGVLSYWPLPGEDVTKADVVAPVVRQTLVRFAGKPAEKLYIDHLRFEGISFQHTDPYIAPDMPFDSQGAVPQKPAIEAIGLRHSVFKNCEIAHVGENGLWLDSGCTDNLIQQCHTHDLGASAVFVGPRDDKITPDTAVVRNTVDNNFIHDGSHIFRGSQGVWIGRASYNNVTHNEICDFHHIGISIGHSWGYAPSSAHHNTIALNHVHHICKGMFSDGGAIYTLGDSPGTVIKNNLVHDVMPNPQMPVGGTGIYHDEGSTGIVVEDNIVYNCGAGLYNQHYGKENIARNNILAFALRDPVTCCRAEEHLSFTFEGNIVLSNCGEMTSDHFSPLRAKTSFARNLYWDVSGKEPTFAGVSFKKWQESGRDVDSKIADPQFVDASRFNFQLKPGSPALAMGFRPISMEKVGLYGDAAWTEAPRKIERAPLPELGPLPPAPPPKPFSEDFESFKPGETPGYFSYSPRDRRDLVRVSDTTAAGGKNCLKFTKVEGLPQSFQPHMFFSTRPYTSGQVRFACDVLIDAQQPAEFWLGLRDYLTEHGKYLEGPSLTIRPDGSLMSSGKSVMKLPLGQWIHFDVVVDLGAPPAPAASAKSYRLTVTPSGGEAKTFASLPCASSAFAQVTWFGFSSLGKKPSVARVDNLRLEAVK